MLQKKILKANGEKRALEKLKEDERPEISPLQTLRHFSTMNLELYSGIEMYNLFESYNSGELINCFGFIAGMMASGKVANTILKRVIPYEHED